MSKRKDCKPALKPWLFVALMTLGSATIYGSPVAEIADGAEMKQLVGICPQFNIIFDVLTVEEHLKVFAAIKGILPCDIDNEVRTQTAMYKVCGYLTSHLYVLVPHPIPVFPSSCCYSYTYHVKVQ